MSSTWVRFAVLSFASSLALGTASSSADALGPAALLSPTSGAWLGAYVRTDYVPPTDYVGLESQFAALESTVGRRLDIYHVYLNWQDQIANPMTNWAIQGGMLPLVSWHGTDTRRIASGSLDDQIRAQATATKALGTPIFIRWGWEMEGNRNTWWVHSPADYIAAWIHIREVFSSVGATNVAWVWCPSAQPFATGVSQSYYPGDPYVDWLCADGYNWAPGIPGLAWTSFRDVFDRFYAWASTKDKPVMIAETGVQERGLGEKAAWLAAIPSVLEQDYPNIQALVYFDTHSRYDWRLNSSDAAIASFKEVAAVPYLNPPGAVGPPAERGGDTSARPVIALVAVSLAALVLVVLLGSVRPERLPRLRRRP